MFCLSKGLCAPVGSILVGTRGFIDKARKMRKLMGGGMRQAGIIAAPGLIALKEMRQHLAKDHEMAKNIAVQLSKLPYIKVNVQDIEVNIL